jgi:hypothetical protein
MILKIHQTHRPKTQTLAFANVQPDPFSQREFKKGSFFVQINKQTLLGVTYRTMLELIS